MSVYQTKEFARFARRNKLSAKALWRAATDVAAGKFDADLGGGVFKQRIARSGSGKSGGFRTILFFREGRHSFFAYGFAKNERANISAKELKALKKLAGEMLEFSSAQIAAAEQAGELSELVDEYDEENNQA